MSLGDEVGHGAALATPASTTGIASDVSPLDARRFLVRTGDMSLTVAKGGVPEAAARVVGLTTGYGGYVLTSQVSTADASSPPFADITVRVPADVYDWRSSASARSAACRACRPAPTT